MAAKSPAETAELFWKFALADNPDDRRRAGLAFSNALEEVCRDLDDVRHRIKLIEDSHKGGHA